MNVAVRTAEARLGDWMQTFTGVKFWPLDPRPEEVKITDIAHALSNLCRYGGHVKQFYSVAEHSVHVSDYLPKEYRKWGLLHDASEAYLVDIIRPVKKHLANYLEIEERLMKVIAQKFDLPWPMPDIVKQVDMRILLDEREAFMGKPAGDWECDGMKPVGAKLLGVLPREAENWFMDRWLEVV